MADSFFPFRVSCLGAKKKCRKFWVSCLYIFLPHHFLLSKPDHQVEEQVNFPLPSYNPFAGIAHLLYASEKQWPRQHCLQMVLFTLPGEIQQQNRYCMYKMLLVIYCLHTLALTEWEEINPDWFWWNNWTERVKVSDNFIDVAYIFP